MTMSILNILEELATTPSRLAKEAILRREHNNADLKSVVQMALDPLLQFYIRRIPAYKPTAKTSTPTLAWGMAQLSDLSTRRVTGNAGIAHLRSILEQLNVADSLVIERIICKDLRCGVSVATANKTWPGLVNEFPCMLASQYEEKLIGKFKFPAYVQLKLDGMRASFVVEQGAVTAYSRNGKIIDLPEIAAAILSVGYDNVVFDGELLVVDADNHYTNRQTGNGILNKAVKGTITEEERKSVRFVMFDMIPLQDFKKGTCIVPYETRFDSLNEFIRTASSNSYNSFFLVETWDVANIEGAQTIFNEVLAEGQEGIILKDKKSVWENKRSKGQIKFKAELDCDLVCVDVEEGTGKYKDKMGALVLESSDGVIRVNVGTGFSDADRQELWKNKPLGKIVAVCYNARISDKNSGVESLFLPRFLEVREDKTTADSSKVIK